MLDCWNDDPSHRPTFDRLYGITTEFLQNEVQRSSLFFSRISTLDLVQGTLYNHEYALIILFCTVEGVKIPL